MKNDSWAEINWYRLDNSAKIYPAIISDRETTLFRISFTLKETVDPQTLQKAMDNVYDRFPYYNVKLGKGIFWNYLEKNSQPHSIYCDTPSPCENINAVYYNGYLYKVLYFKNKISTEFSHVMTDGYGGLEYTKTLVMEYLRLCGYEIENDGTVIEPDSEIDPMEVSDDHKRYSTSPDHPEPEKNEKNLFGDIKAFQTKGRFLPLGTFHVITGILKISDIKKISKYYGVTITEFIVAVYMDALIEIQKEQIKNPANYQSVAIQVPVNMRNMLKSCSMRNFSLFVTPTVAPPDFPDFEGLISFIKGFVRENTSIDKMMQLLRYNVSLGESNFVRHVPLFLKLPITKYIISTRGSAQHSGTFSNLGLVKLPPSMSDHIEQMTCNLAPDPNSKATCGAIGYKGNLYLTFGSTIRNKVIERKFFRRMRKYGVPVSLQSNF